MTVSSTLNRKTYTGDAVTTSFGTSPVTFFDSSDLTVYAVVTATGVATELTENTHYTVTGGAGSTGSVSTAGGASPYGAPAATVTLVIVRDVPLTQETNFENNSSSDADVAEEVADRAVMGLQQIETKVERSMRLSDSDVSGASVELPTPEASTVLAWDDTGLALENIAPGSAALQIPADLSVTTAKIATNAVTNAKLATMVANTIKANATASTAVPTDVAVAASRVFGRKASGNVTDMTLSEALDLIGSAAQGDILYRDSSAWARLGAGTSGQFLKTQGAAANPLWAAASGITLGTPAVTTSGTAVEFTGLPAGTKRIVFSLSGVSTNGTNNYLIQIGPSGGAETSGYNCGYSALTNAGAVSTGTYSTGAGVASGSAANVFYGHITFVLENSSTNTWSYQGTIYTGTAVFNICGTKPLAGAMSRIRITTVGGTDTFDAGEINITYE